ncbi:MAG: hypothetical protein KC620_05605, partial [Myxococcales bacterium]|nr:hypothetical protein [Myxococcales bacterium]
ALQGAERELYESLSSEARAAGRRAALVALIAHRAGQRPLLLMVEDLHWADAAARRDLLPVVEALLACPVLWLCTTRPEEEWLDAAWAAAALAPDRLTVFNLSPFDADEARELADRALHTLGGQIDPALAAACIERAEGNPLFLAELLFSARHVGVGQIPSSVQGLVLSRVDRLDARDRRAVQRAAILGAEVDLEVLRWLIDDAAYDPTPLVEARLLRREGAALFFAHALVLDGIYHAQLRSTRRSLHARVGEWYLDRDLESAAGHLAQGDDPRAAQAFFDAAHLAADRLHLERALALTERGRACTPNREVDARLQLLQAQTRFQLGDTEGAIAGHRALLATAPSDDIALQASIGLANGLRVISAADEAFALLDEIEALATRLDLPQALAEICSLRGNLFFARGEADACVAAHAQALACAQASKSVKLEVQALGGMGDALYMQARMASAHDAFRRCVDRARVHGFARIEAANLGMVAYTAWYTGSRAEALEVAAEAIQRARETTHHRAELVAQSLVAEDCAEQLDLAGLDAVLERLEALQSIIKARLWTPFHLGGRGRVLWFTGHREEGRALLVESMEQVRRIALRYMGPAVLGFLSEVTDDPTERQAALDEAFALVAQGGPGHNPLHLYASMVRGAVARQAWDEAEQAADRFEAFSHAEPLPRSRFFIDVARAFAAVGRGATGPQIEVEIARLGAIIEREQPMLRAALHHARASLRPPATP